MSRYNTVKIKADPAWRTVNFQSTQEKYFTKFIRKCNGSVYYQLALQSIEWDVFNKMDTFDKIRYVETYMSTMGRKAFHLSKVHYVNLLKANFDFAKEEVTIADLLSPDSAGTNAKNLMTAINRAEMSWVEEYQIMHNNALPNNRQQGAVLFVIGSAGITSKLTQLQIQLKKFLNKYYVKDPTKYVRGNQNKGFSMKDFTEVHEGCYRKYTENPEYHTPTYLAGILMMILVVLFNQRDAGEWYMLRMGNDVYHIGGGCDGEMWVFKRPMGIKNNQITAHSRSTHEENKIVYIRKDSVDPWIWQILCDYGERYRPKIVRDQAYFMLPRPDFLNELQVAPGESIGFYSDNRLGTLGFKRSFEAVIKSFDKEWRGNLNDFKYTTMELMILAKLSDTQIKMRSGHTSNVIESYKENVIKHMQFKSTANILHSQIRAISGDMEVGRNKNMDILRVSKQFEAKSEKEIIATIGALPLPPDFLATLPANIIKKPERDIIVKWDGKKNEEKIDFDLDFAETERIGKKIDILQGILMRYIPAFVREYKLKNPDLFLKNQ